MRSFPLSSFSFFSLCLSTACAQQRSTLEPDELVVYASSTDVRGPEVVPRTFAVGLESELRVSGEFGMDRKIESVRCEDDSCSVATLPSATHPRYPLFLVTPKARVFNVHVEVDGPASIDRRVEAADGSMIALHRGAGPGTPFVAGMHVVWYVGTKAKNVAWKAEGSTFSVTPPFIVVGDPQFGEGPDRDTFARVEILAPHDLTTTVSGTLEHRIGSTTTSFPIVAVPRAEIASLHVAEAPDVPKRENAELPKPLRALAGGAIDVPRYRGQRAWVVFETKGGVFGLAGAGECAPAQDATFALRPYRPAFHDFELGKADDAIPPADQPILDLEGTFFGASDLVLTVGDVTGRAEVTVR